MKRSWKVGILLFDKVDILDFTGPYEVFSMTVFDRKDVQQLILASNSRMEKPFQVSTVTEDGEEITTHHGLQITPSYSFENAPAFDILLVPGGPYEALKNVVQNGRILHWIKEQAQGVDIIASVCSGALLLAYAGLLSGKKATTNRQALLFLEERFPDVKVDHESRVVVDGKLITSQGVSAGIDLAFHVVEQKLGQAAARTTAETIEYLSYSR